MTTFHRGALALLSACFVSTMFAQTAAVSTTGPLSFHGDVRSRYEAYSNAQTLNAAAAYSDRDYIRERFRLWGTYTVNPQFSVFARASAEPRYWFNAVSPNPGDGYECKYAILDNAYVRWANGDKETPVTVTLGRQDIQLGDLWLVSDGTPIDGSWTNGYDALRITVESRALHTTFDLIGLNQQARAGDRISVLGNVRDHSGAKYLLTEQDETGVILYVSNKSLPGTQVDGYFIYKGDDRIDAIAKSKIKGVNADVYTVGSRVTGTPGAHWSYAAEAAVQWGRRNDTIFTASRDVRAFGGTAKLTYLFKDPLANQLSLNAEYLSGDRSSTSGKDEMFDNLWGRTPRVGETWAVAYAAETGGRPSQYNNLFRVGPSWTIAPTKTISLAATYYAMFAPESTPTRATSAALFSRSGHFRGHMFQVQVKRKFTAALSGLILAEMCPLGNYYAHRDTIAFERVELTLAF